MAALFRPIYRILLTEAIPLNTTLAGNTERKIVIDDTNSQNIAPVTLNDAKTIITLPAGKLYKVTFLNENIAATANFPFLFKITSNPIGGAVRSTEDWENTPLPYYTAGRAGQIFNLIDLTDTETNEEMCLIVENPRR